MPKPLLSMNRVKIGRKGILLVMVKLVEFGIDYISTPFFWPFDLILFNGKRLEVKYSNIGKCVSGRGDVSERFTFRISKGELEVVDYVILVLNTVKGYFFYVIPKKAITGSMIAFNPFSTQRSKYEKYKDHWDFLSDSSHPILKNIVNFEYHFHDNQITKKEEASIDYSFIS